MDFPDLRQKSDRSFADHLPGGHSFGDRLFAGLRLKGTSAS
jgi:hypothetical protein